MERFVLIDGNAILYRAFHALPPLTSSKGEVVNAVYGFFSMFLKIVADIEPACIVVCFDRPKPTFRQQLYVGYQAQRPKMDGDLVPQIVLVHEILEKAGVKIFEVDGYEADDLIGTLAFQAVQRTEDRRQKTDSGRQRTEDGNEEMVVGDQTRIENALPTINYLLAQNAKIILLSHLGRPGGKFIPELSLRPVVESLATILQRCNIVRQEGGWQIGEEIFLRENLRFNPGEEKNNLEFAQKLASLGDFYINEAFAVSHREHASIVTLPQQLKSKNSVAAGLSLLREIEVLFSILENPKRPLVVILGGAKEDKLEVVPGLLKLADYVLIGGKLPALIPNSLLCRQAGQFPIPNSPKIIIADLNPEGKDITLETAEKFTAIIKTAGTIVWSGPMGQYEESNWELGTRELGKAIVNSRAFTIIGGGDTEAALTKFGLVEQINFVSSGGGAMLEFLANGDLPGLKALRVQV